MTVILLPSVPAPICRDPSGRSIHLFACGDQLLKRAALNAVQIAECLVRGRAAAVSA